MFADGSIPRVLALAGLFMGRLAHAEGLEFESSGGASLVYYLTQTNRYSQMPPGYRFEFSLDNRIYEFEHGHAFVNLDNATVISRQDSAAVKLDKIRYKIEPGYRHIWPANEAALLVTHECIHQIDRERTGGSIYWNAIQLDYGTRGAYDRNMIARVVERDFQLRNSWDYAVSVEAFLFGDASVWIGQNHNYRANAQGLLRYNWSLWTNAAFYVDLRHQAWMDSDASLLQKGEIQLNWILLSRRSIGVIYLQYGYLDQNKFDNENRLLGLGFRIIH